MSKLSDIFAKKFENDLIEKLKEFGYKDYKLDISVTPRSHKVGFRNQYVLNVRINDFILKLDRYSIHDFIYEYDFDNINQLSEYYLNEIFGQLSTNEYAKNRSNDVFHKYLCFSNDEIDNLPKNIKQSFFKLFDMIKELNDDVERLNDEIAGEDI